MIKTKNLKIERRPVDPINSIVIIIDTKYNNIIYKSQVAPSVEPIEFNFEGLLFIAQVDGRIVVDFNSLKEFVDNPKNIPPPILETINTEPASITE